MNCRVSAGPATALPGLRAVGPQMKALRMPSRLSVLAVVAAEGFSRETIAERLGISRHTVIEHRKWMHNRLDVHNRAELTNKLLAGLAPPVNSAVFDEAPLPYFKGSRANLEAYMAIFDE